MQALIELENEFNRAKNDKHFLEEYHYYLREYDGRPTPLYCAENLTRTLGGAKIYLKREDLNHTGAHKINNALGQVLLAKRMGRSASLLKLVLGNTASPPLLWQHCSVWNVKSSWEQKTSRDSG